MQDTKVKGLSDTVSTALWQIEQRNYQAALTAKGILKEHIRKYGFVFCGKEVLIGTFYVLQFPEQSFLQKCLRLPMAGASW